MKSSSKSSARGPRHTHPANDHVAEPPSTDVGQHAYEVLRDQIRAVDPATVRRLRVNPADCVSLVLSCESSLRGLVGIPADDGPVVLEAGLIDDAVQLANAAGYVASIVDARRRPLASVSGQIAQAVAARGRAIRWIDMAIIEGRLDAAARVRVSSPRGYAELGRDVVRAATAIKDNWSSLEGFVPYTLDDLTAAITLGRAVSTMVAARVVDPTARSTTVEDLIRERDASFELLIHAWGRIQRRVQYLRFAQRDVNRYAPSLFVQVTGGRRRKVVEETTDEPAVDEPAPEAASAEG